MTVSFRPFLALASLLTIAGFVLDAVLPLGVAAGLPYVIVVAICLLSRSRRMVLGFGLSGMVLTVAGVLVSPVGEVDWIVATNRGLTLLALFLLTLMGYRLLSQHLELEEGLRKLADTDVLTGLASRRRLFEALDGRVREAQRYQSELSLLLIDLDEFKAVNDQCGHLAGDEVLRQVVKVSSAALRGSDLLGRFGGDELVVLCPSTGPKGARHLAERIRAAVEKLDLRGVGVDRGITVSIGVASWEPSVGSSAALLSTADKALYQAKEAGRNRVALARFQRAQAM